MKTCLAFLLLGSIAWAQSFSPAFSTVPITFGKSHAFNPSFYNFGISTNTAKAKPMFTYYNYVTGTNDYVDADGNARSMVLADNTLRGVKIDSFNPNGATDFKSALLSGALNYIFNGNSGKSPFLK